MLKAIPKVVVSPARIEDISAVCALYDELFSAMAHLQPESFQRAEQEHAFLEAAITSESNALLLAWEGERIVGFVLVQEQSTPAYGCIVPHRYAYLMDLLVSNRLRGHGIGSLLISAASDWAKLRGLDYIELNVIEENLGAIRLYRSQGFRSTMRSMRLKLK